MHLNKFTFLLKVRYLAGVLLCLAFFVRYFLLGKMPCLSKNDVETTLLGKFELLLDSAELAFHSEHEYRFMLFRLD